jgi:hypothetical protein
MFDVISVNDGNLNRVNKLTDIHKPMQPIRRSMDEKLGTLPGEIHLHTDPSVHFVVMPKNRFPFGIYDKLKAELDRMNKLGLIAPSTELTSWVSQIFTTSWVSQIFTTVRKNSDLWVGKHLHKQTRTQ